MPVPSSYQTVGQPCPATEVGRLLHELGQPLLELTTSNVHACSSHQPVTVGVPFPIGLVSKTDNLILIGPAGCPAPLQCRPLAHWNDGSVKWVLLDFILPPGVDGEARWVLCQSTPESVPVTPELRSMETPDAFVIETGAATFRLDRRLLKPPDSAFISGQEILDAKGCNIALSDRKGRAVPCRVEHSCIEELGPVRATIRLEGSFPGVRGCRFVSRWSFFAGLGLARLRFTLHNPQRARHPGGLWDLGDAGSIVFRELTLHLTMRRSTALRIGWQAEPGLPCRWITAGALEVYQDSSGGDNWDSVNHVSRAGHVPCSFRGYRVRFEGREERGLRASPVVALRGAAGSIGVALPEFWQQFPKALEADGNVLRVSLFPQQFGDLFELQGGEQKTHTVWLQFDSPSPDTELPLGWTHQAARVRAAPGWYAASGALAPFAPAQSSAATPLEDLLTCAVDGTGGLSARREIIDEYGWRNFGEVYADHEAAYYQNPAPVISHYNNQYDVVYGTLLHYLRTGETAWFDLCDPLARHVIDIDIYHTDRDRAAYNGGLFWFTDHYKTAGTCTHRTYSRTNCVPGDRSYGGGPSSAHNFTTGLLHYYYLTGDPDARAAVIGLADWVLAMDDGRRTILGLADDGPTGLASCTFQLDYQGPGRGCGNSVNALLDAWLVTTSRHYLDQAETLIRRCVHPDDDIAARDLLNVEQRWSYTVFLSALARYLRLKAEHAELDTGYAYARASLLHYAGWMAEHEMPYFDQVDKLEFPTEAWAAQELRKANVLRLAAAYADEPLRGRLQKRGNELADRGWSDLMRFASRTTARALAIVMVEGLQDLALRTQPTPVAPRPTAPPGPGAPQLFIPQKKRVHSQVRSLRGIGRLLARLANPAVWLRFGRLARQA